MFSRQTSDRAYKNFPPILHCHKFQYLPPPRRQRAGNTHFLAGNIVVAAPKCVSSPVRASSSLDPIFNGEPISGLKMPVSRRPCKLETTDKNTRLKCPQMGLPMTHENRTDCGFGPQKHTVLISKLINFGHPEFGDISNAYFCPWSLACKAGEIRAF